MQPNKCTERKETIYYIALSYVTIRKIERKRWRTSVELRRLKKKDKRQKLSDGRKWKPSIASSMLVRISDK